jgi:hypothetical protein
LDVTSASITCTTVTGNAKLAPHIGPTVPTAVNTNISLSVSGCSVLDKTGAPVTVNIHGSGKGVLHASPGTVSGSTVSATTHGFITIKWTSSSHLTVPNSQVSLTSVTVDASGTNAVVTGVGPTVGGDFAGVSGTGAASTFSATSSLTIANLAAAFTAGGLKSVALGSGSLHLG